MSCIRLVIEDTSAFVKLMPWSEGTHADCWQNWVYKTIEIGGGLRPGPLAIAILVIANVNNTVTANAPTAK
jgi:hypothetical protein